VHAASDQDRGRCAALAEIGHDVAHAAAYFQLGPIERRIYEVTRSTSEVEALDLDLATVSLQIGNQNPLSNFKAALKQIVATDGIPTSTSNWSKKRFP
jgi:hypothetical protein